MMTFDPLNDGKSKVELVESMGGDLAIVNDARASFDKASTELSDRDKKLIHYLIKHNHTSPLRGTVLKFKVKAPLYLCRQFWKHVIGSNHNDEQLGWNEKSFRYVEAEDEGEFYIPDTFRLQSKSNRQATDGELSKADDIKAGRIYIGQCHSSYAAYKELLELGVGREQARGVLAPSVYTSWVWTASLQSVLNFIDLRQGKGAQSEISAYAGAIALLTARVAPVTMDAWQQNKSHIDE